MYNVLTHPKGFADFESMAVKLSFLCWKALQGQLVVKLRAFVREWLENTFLSISLKYLKKMHYLLQYFETYF